MQLERIFGASLKLMNPCRPVKQAIGEILVGMDDALRIGREVARILQEHGDKVVPDIVFCADVNDSSRIVFKPLRLAQLTSAVPLSG